MGELSPLLCAFVAIMSCHPDCVFPSDQQARAWGGAGVGFCQQLGLDRAVTVYLMPPTLISPPPNGGREEKEHSVLVL